MGKGDNKPRGRMSAYAFFVQTCREEHKKKHPDESVVFAEFSRRCADRWKTMNEKEKTRFHQMAEKDKKRYESEMANYNPPEKNSKSGKAAKGAKRKRTKDPHAPKRSLSAFFWFSNDERPKVKETMQDATVGDVAKELGKRWNEASSDIRSKYEALAAKDKARYMKEVKAYKGGKKVKGAPSKSKKKNDSDEESGEEEEEEEEQEEEAEPEEEEEEEEDEDDE